MPKGFSQKEKEIIYAKLLDKGREFMSIYGIRKTTVEELAKAVGISKGAFYSFFDSKEELFFRILEIYEAEMQKHLFNCKFDSNLSPKENFKAFLKEILVIVSNNPFMKMLNKEEFQCLLMKLPEERTKQTIDASSLAISKFIEIKKQEGLFNNYDSKVIAEIFKALFYIYLHKEDFNQELFVPMYEAIIDMICNSLLIN